MSKPPVTALTARILPGTAMVSAQSTAILRLKVIEPPSAAVHRARGLLHGHLPRWIGSSVLTGGGPVLPPWASPAAALLSELVVAIQQEAGIAVGLPPAVTTQERAGGELILYLPNHSARASKAAISWACSLLNSLLVLGAAGDVGASVKLALEQLKPFAESGVNNFFIFQAATAMGIPVFRPLPDLLVLGTGSRSRWLQSLVSDETTFLGVQFAQAKHLTASLLRAAGLPGAEHCLVTSKQQALDAAVALGYPLVVKPADADRGAGVAAGLRDAHAVAQAFDAALRVSPKVLVERWAPGYTHRLTVQDGSVVRVVRRIAGGVIGDGVHSIEDLVTLAQQSMQQQRFARRLGYQPLALDDEATSLLEEQAFTAQSRPDPGYYVRLRRRDNVNAGGTNEELSLHDATCVHPDNLRLAVEAARVLCLDFAGIDLITTDISRSWLEVGALICEVNARPQMGATHDPVLYQRVLGHMFPQGACVFAELVVVPAELSEQEAVMTYLLSERPHASGSLASGLWIHGVRSTPAFRNSFEAARALLQRREVEHAICCMTVQDIWQYGLPLHKWDAVEAADPANWASADAVQSAGVRNWLQRAVVQPI